MAIHYQTVYGLDRSTACGKSLHGWADISRRNPLQSTVKLHEVTCKKCLAALERTLSSITR
jgi:hypothetical protein